MLIQLSGLQLIRGLNVINFQQLKERQVAEGGGMRILQGHCSKKEEFWGNLVPFYCCSYAELKKSGEYFGVGVVCFR